MPAIAGTPTAKTRSRIAVAARLGDSLELAAAKRDHAAAKLEQYVERVVADAPPLTAEQRDRIAALLRPTAERIA